MKIFAKRILRLVAAKLPTGAQDAILDGILDSADPWRVLARAAPMCATLVAAKLRTGAQDAILDGILDSADPWRVLARAAPKCEVASLRVSGAYGVIQSAATDVTILRKYAETRVWAQRTNDLLLSFFSGRGEHYIDVGANIGLTTIPVAQNAKVRCLALEPEPTNFANLLVNLATNCSHGNVETRQLAVFNKRDTLRFELAPENLGDHRLRLNENAGLIGEENWQTIKVEAAPLDEIVTEVYGPLAVKIDTQGAEPFVFAGGARTLAGADLIVTEWAPYWMAKLGGDPTTVTDFLGENFSSISIAEGEEGTIPPFEAVTIVTERLLEMAHRYSSNPLRYCDVIARK